MGRFLECEDMSAVSPYYYYFFMKNIIDKFCNSNYPEISLHTRLSLLCSVLCQTYACRLRGAVLPNSGQRFLEREEVLYVYVNIDVSMVTSYIIDKF